MTLIGAGGPTPSGNGGADSLKVKVTSADTIEDFLNSKVSVGTGITKTVLNPGANEQLELASHLRLHTLTDPSDHSGNLPFSRVSPGISPSAGTYEAIKTISIAGRYVVPIYNEATDFGFTSGFAAKSGVTYFDLIRLRIDESLLSHVDVGDSTHRINFFGGNQDDAYNWPLGGHSRFKLSITGLLTFGGMRRIDDPTSLGSIQFASNEASSTFRYLMAWLRKNSTGSNFSRPRRNVIEGQNISITVTDDPTDDEIDETYALTGRISQENTLLGTVILLNADETDVSGTTTNTTAKTFSLAANTYARIMVEAEINLVGIGNELDQVTFDLKIDGTNVDDTVILQQAVTGAGDLWKLAGNVKGSKVQTGAATVTLSVTVNNGLGTWTVRSLRVYGVI